MRRTEDWHKYFELGRGRPVRPEFLGALALVPEQLPRRAIDLGAGDGVETRHLLHTGWRVVSLDGTPGIRDRVLEGLDPSAIDRVDARDALFSQITSLPPSAFTYAGMALPFCDSVDLPGVIDAVSDSLLPGGIFAAHFLGKADAWSSRSGVSTLSEAEVRDLLDGLDILTIEEREFDGPSGLGPKHWHVYFVTAQKR